MALRAPLIVIYVYGKHNKNVEIASSWLTIVFGKIVCL